MRQASHSPLIPVRVIGHYLCRSLLVPFLVAVRLMWDGADGVVDAIDRPVPSRPALSAAPSAGCEGIKSPVVGPKAPLPSWPA
jgi:hypothetical protein